MCWLPSEREEDYQVPSFSAIPAHPHRPPELAARESDSSRASMSRLRCFVATISAIIASRFYWGLGTRSSMGAIMSTHRNFIGRVHVVEADFVGSVGCENTLRRQGLRFADGLELLQFRCTCLSCAHVYHDYNPPSKLTASSRRRELISSVCRACSLRRLAYAASSCFPCEPSM